MISRFAIAATQRFLRRRNIGSLIVTRLPNIRYLTGFTGSTALALVTGSKCFLLLDSRYLEQGRREVQNATVIAVEREPWKTLVSLIRSLRLRRAGFEFHAMPYELFWNIKRALPGVPLTAQEGLVEILRRVKSAAEVEAIGKALQLTEQGFREVLPLIRTGMREIELAAELEFRLRRKGAQAFAFNTIISSGSRSAYPHGVATTKRIRAGDPVVMDFGICLEGYVSDFTRTVILGKASKPFRRAYDAVRGALEETENSLLAGNEARLVDRICRRFLEKAGFGSYFLHGTGHGLGLEIHEAPSISAHSTAVIQRNDVFTVEPGIYLPGQFGIRIEDVVWIRESGCHKLTRTSHDLIEL